jgi:hypothetical protein
MVNGDYDKNEKKFTSDNAYVLDLFSMTVVDCNQHKSNKDYIFFDADKFVGEAHPCASIPKSLGYKTWKMNMRDKNGTNLDIPLHQLGLAVARANGMTVGTNRVIQTFLQQQSPGKSFADLYNVPLKDKALSKKTKSKRGYLPSRNCDGDHLVGRNAQWMNSPLFVMDTSHSQNSHLRCLWAETADWLFMYGKLTHETGAAKENRTSDDLATPSRSLSERPLGSMISPETLL